MTRYKWHGPKVTAALKRGIAENIERAARELRDFIREHVSVAGPTPSAPGEYPHKQLGHLRRNMAMEMDVSALRARVGTNVLYGKFLELGTRNMSPRPIITQALKDFGPRLKQLLGTPVRGNT